MARYIDADKIEYVVDCEGCYGAELGHCKDCKEEPSIAFHNDIVLIPTADVAPVVHAKWVIDDSERSIYGEKVWRCHCSNCLKDPIDFVSGSENWWTYLHRLPKICCHCGAKMDKEGDDDIS